MTPLKNEPSPLTPIEQALLKRANKLTLDFVYAVEHYIADDEADWDYTDEQLGYATDHTRHLREMANVPGISPVVWSELDMTISAMAAMTQKLGAIRRYRQDLQKGPGRSST